MLSGAEGQARLQDDIGGGGLRGFTPARYNPEALLDAGWLVAGPHAVHPLLIRHLLHLQMQDPRSFDLLAALFDCSLPPL